MGQQLASAGSPLALEALLPWIMRPRPVTEKESGNGWCNTTGLMWGYSSMQGWRDAMEDAHIAKPQLFPPVPRAPMSQNWGETSIFAVMDGHGGEQVARFCELHLPSEIAKRSCWEIASALRSTYHCMDEMLRDPRSHPMLRSLTRRMPIIQTVDPCLIGCTAVTCCVCPDVIVVANAGDSRAVLCRSGRAIDMSEDHKPNLPGECARIENAGGCIVNQRFGPHVLHRVNGDLSLSRSIGDLRFKQNAHLAPEHQMVCSTPDIRFFRRQVNDEFMVIACDGIWDVLSSQQVVDFIRPRLGDLISGRIQMSEVIEHLLDACLSPDPRRTYGIGGDNMTMVVVTFTEPPANSRDTIFPSLLHCCGPISTPASFRQSLDVSEH
uniref:PPM-type phosphatase domain-containing protein n=1 Tax=Alexandrium monilatum TaxID=311494 RepID=A0A7S4UBM0_9DINO